MVSQTTSITEENKKLKEMLGELHDPIKQIGLLKAKIQELEDQLAVAQVQNARAQEELQPYLAGSLKNLLGVRGNVDETRSDRTRTRSSDDSDIGRVETVHLDEDGESFDLGDEEEEKDKADDTSENCTGGMMRRQGLF